MDYWLHLVLYVAFVGAPVLWGLDTLQKRARARRQRLTTVAARFGLFVSWIATGVALILGGLGAVGFYNEPTPFKQEVWITYGGLCAGAFVAWLLGRGFYFVLAGSPPEEPQDAQAVPPIQYSNQQYVRRPVPTSIHQMGPGDRKAPPPRP
jgi:hypothetical protein